MMKKIWSVLLSICLILSLAAPTLAAPIKTSGAASTLKLESVDGTAKLNNASGKEVKTTKGARLYNGYKLATEKASYAYVSLDDTKAIKLDASSSSEVFQSGKKLELKVTSGQMFFNVTAPLKSDESLNIRTSTMVTGVRGTSGWISVIDRFTTQVSLLEGELTITSTDPLTGQQRTITIVGGQTATIVYHGKDKNYASEIIIEDQTIQDLIEDGTIRDEHIVLEETGLTVENLQEEDVPGFVAVEVKKDKELQKKIEENSPLSVPAIIGDAEERLEKEEAAAEAADKAIQEELEKLTADDVDPLFEESSTVSGGSAAAPTYTLELSEFFETADGPDGVYLIEERTTSTAVAQNSTYRISAPTGYILQSVLEYTADSEIAYEIANNQTSVPVDMDKQLEITYTSTTSAYLADPTVTEVNTALGTYPTVYITGSVYTDTANTVDLVNGKTLHFRSTTSGLRNGVILSAAQNSSIFVDEGTFTNNGNIQNNGTLTVAAGATLDNQNDIRGVGTITVLPNATLDNNATLLIESSNSLHVQGSLINDYTIDIGTPDDPDTGVAGNPGLLALEGIGKFTNNGELIITENGSMTLAPGTAFTNGTTGIINNDGTITNSGTFGGSFNVDTNSYFDPSVGTFINNGTLNPTDDLYSMVVDSSNKIIAWKTMNQLFAADGWTDGATHTLVGKQASTNWTMISATEKTVTLDLNGRTLTLPDIFHVSGGSMTITDSFVTENGAVVGTLSIADTNANGERIGNTIVVLDDGTLTLEGGTIESPSNGTSVQVGSYPAEEANTTPIVGTFIMNGGILVSDYIAVNVDVGSSFTLNDGTVEADYAAVYVSSDASFAMKGGEVISTRDTAISLYGTFTMDGGTVTGYTNGIYSYSADPSVNITLNKGTVKIENTAAGVQYPYGAAIMVCYYYSEGASENDPPVLSCPVIQINNVTYSPESETCEAVAGSGIKLYIPCDENDTTLKLDDVLLGGKLVTYVDEEVGSVSLTPAIAITNLEI